MSEERIGLHYYLRGRRTSVVAVVHDGCDWAAYIGATDEATPKEEAEQLVSERGDKLHESVARAFFPCIGERYRP